MSGPSNSAPQADDAITFGPFRLLPAQQMLLKADKPVRLGSRALEILTALVERPGELVSKAELVRRVWPNTVVEESNLKVHVAALRRALGDGHHGNRFVVNIPGRGYQFVAPVGPAISWPPQESQAVAQGYSRNLPTPLTRMLGRAEIIGTIISKFKQSRFVTIVGPGGIGKTTVALAVAAELTGSYKDGGSFVDLAPLADPSIVPSTLATVLGITARSEDPLPGLISFLAGKQMLIVLDSCEHVIAAAAGLAEGLLKGVADLRILATSREPLRVAGEAVQRLLPLSTPSASAEVTVAEALTFPSIQLFVERASARVDTFRLDDTDAPLIADICRRLDGNPLAIELAAGRVDAFGVRGIATQLDDRFKLLTSGWRNSLPRHQTLMVTLDWSYELLAEVERVILRRLGIFAGYFTLDAASGVAASSTITASGVANGVANLVDKSLISAEPAGASPRYRLLDTTCAYARKQLADHGEVQQLARRHAEYYLSLLERAGPGATQQRTVDWLVNYGAHIDNVRAALDWAFSPSGDPAIGVALTIASFPLWLNVSLMDECRKHAKRALESVTSISNEAARQEMQLLAALGVALYSIGPGPDTKIVWTKVLKIAEGLEDIDYRLRALWGLWEVCVTVSKHRSGLLLARKFAKLASDASDPVALRVGDRLIGTSLHFLGEQRAARRHIERGLNRPTAIPTRSQIVRFQFDQSVAGRAYFSRILWLQGFPEQAMEQAERCVAEAQASRHALSMCYALGQAACPIALLTGNLALAEQRVAMLLDYAKRHVLPLWRGKGRCFSGMLSVRKGDRAAGLLLHGAAIDELQETGFSPYHTGWLCEYAEALGSAGEIARARAAIGLAMTQAKRSHSRWYEPELLRVKGELLLLQGDRRCAVAAQNHFKKSFALARQQGSLSWQLRTATSLARLRQGQVRKSEAHAILARTYARFTEGFTTTDLRAARQLLDEPL
jgi:predicted ATPase/DNA-binding winged helix-turn-helix (wHTH) protein